MGGEDDALEPSANGLLAAIYVLHSTINTWADTHVIYSSYI